MLIVLPNAKNGLPALLESLSSSAENFASVLNADHFHTTDVALQLPVFSIEGDIYVYICIRAVGRIPVPF